MQLIKITKIFLVKKQQIHFYKTLHYKVNKINLYIIKFIYIFNKILGKTSILDPDFCFFFLEVHNDKKTKEELYLNKKHLL